MRIQRTGDEAEVVPHAEVHDRKPAPQHVRDGVARATDVDSSVAHIEFGQVDVDFGLVIVELREYGDFEGFFHLFDGFSGRGIVIARGSFVAESFAFFVFAAAATAAAVFKLLVASTVGCF